MSSSGKSERRVNIRNADRVIDRYIPRASSPQRFKAFGRQLEDTESSSSHRTSGEMSISLNNESITARPVISSEQEQTHIFTDTEVEQGSSSSPSIEDHNTAVANALGFIGNDISRVLNYKVVSKTNSPPHNNDLLCDITQNIQKNQMKKLQRKKAKTDIKMITPYKVLESQGLRDDFYCNLVSWSRKTDCVIVGLYNRAYIWSETTGAIALKKFSNEFITCVSASNDEFIAVGTQTGRIMLYFQTTQDCLATVLMGDKSICCIGWLPDCSGFFVGNQTGEVSCYGVHESMDGRFNLVTLSSFKYHSQQICGISISSDMKQLAIGCNDNYCTIWDISDRTSPKWKFSLPHNAAVKAIAYCPWSTGLLATGGGCRDRTIRFWHSKTGTLLESLNTRGQITSLIWSPNKKEISATFGFSDSSKAMLIKVYSYPKMEVLVQAKASPSLRALSGVASPSGNRICIAANDATVRFYELWSDRDLRLDASLQEMGIYGSELLELSEEVIRAPANLR